MTATAPGHTLAQLTFDNSYARLGEPFGIEAEPRPLPEPALVHLNRHAARLLDLDVEACGGDVLALASGHHFPDGALPVAMLYAGHQFGSFVPTLGDGRAVLLGQVVNARGERWDLHLKGSGQTIFSRGFDGRSVLRSAIREYLASEAMHALGVPTTRALALVASSEPVQRETVERAAGIVRMAPTHVRFGSFEAFAHTGDLPRLRQLADHVITDHFPALSGRADRYARLLDAAARRTALLMAAWQSLGFVHGVMNTDNFSILGLTLDYGPFAFMEAYDPGFTPNHSDPEGRYAFDQQPAVGQWNVSALAQAFLPLMQREEALAALDAYAPAYEAAYAARMRAKLGLGTSEPGDAALLDDLLAMMDDERGRETGGVDWTAGWRALGAVTRDGSDPRGFSSMFADRARCEAWLAAWRARLAREGPDDAMRRQRMDSVNPRYVLRTWLAQRAIAAAQQGDVAPIAELFEVITHPFDDQPGREAFAAPAAGGVVQALSCSS